MTDKLDMLFGIEHSNDIPTIQTELENDIPVQQLQEIESPVDVALQDASDDFAEIRDQIKSMINSGKDVFDTAHLVAKSSQNPKDIEAFSRIMDTMVKSGKELMTMHKDMFSLKPVVHDVAPQQANTINNVIFQGTSAEFIEYLKSQTKQITND